MIDDDAAPTPEDSVGGESRDIMKVPEVAAYFRVTAYTINVWLRNGAFPMAFKIGGRWRIPREDVIAHAKSLMGDRQGERSPATDPRSKNFRRG